MYSDTSNPFEDPSIAAAANSPTEVASSAPQSNDAPEWLSQPAQVPTNAAAGASPNTFDNGGGGGMYPDKTKEIIKQAELSRSLLMIRVTNIILSILMCVVAVLQGLTDVGAGFFIGIYVISFGVMLCCFETRIPFIETIIRKDFGFMYTTYGRALFMIFIGALCFSLGTLGWIIGGLMVANALFNFYVLGTNPAAFRNSGNSDAGKAKGERQAAAYIQENPELAYKAGAGSIAFAANNPDLAVSAYNSVNTNRV